MTRPTAVTASAWSAIEIVLRQGLQFVVSIILARLLTPEDFGIIALLAFFTNFSIVFVQGGLSIALIQSQSTQHDEESAIFWWNLSASFVVGAIFVAGAPVLANFYDQPVLKSLGAVAALQLVFSAAGAVQTALLTRELRFDRLSRAGVISTLASGIIAIVAASVGAGIWSLALQVIVQSLVNTIALWRAVRWRPSFHFRFDTIRKFFGFGALVTVGNIIEVVYNSGISLIIGKFYGVRELGFYNRAVSTQQVPSSAVSAFVGRIALPLLASKDGNEDALRQSLRLAIGCTMLLNVPIMFGLVLLSDQFVTVLFGARWLPAAPILAILALSGILLPLHVVNVQLVLARAQSRTFIRNELIKKAMGIACVVIGSLYGVIGLAWSQVVYSALGTIVNAAPARDLGYGPVAQLRDLEGIFFASATMAAVVFVLKSQLSSGPLATLILCTLVGFFVYAAVGWLCGIRLFRETATLAASDFLSWRAGKHG